MIAHFCPRFYLLFWNRLHSYMTLLLIVLNITKNYRIPDNKKQESTVLIKQTNKKVRKRSSLGYWKCPVKANHKCRENNKNCRRWLVIKQEVWSFCYFLQNDEMSQVLNGNLTQWIVKFGWFRHCSWLSKHINYIVKKEISLKQAVIRIRTLYCLPGILTKVWR